MVSKPISTAVAAASAAGLPLGAAAAPPAPPPANDMTVSVEGGVAFSKYWQTTFPADAASLLPSPSLGFDKVGSPPTSTGGLQSKNNIGGYGSFSFGRNYQGNPNVDWRFSAAIFDFGTTSDSASASQHVSGLFTSATNTASITENDRFSFQTFDFDFGQKFTPGPIQVRAFAGLRVLHTDERFDTTVATTGLDKIGFLTFDTLATTMSAQGSSEYLGAGPRVGLDFNTIGPWQLVGSVSAAFLEGYRQAQYTTTTLAALTASSSTTGTSLSDYRADWVGNLEAMLGVAWQFSPNAQFMVGYKVDQWYNIRNSFSFAGFANKQDVLTQTPFLRVTLRY